jgi:2-polyprenyl-6-hydroxyphenyl methylase/3-demethylubiquinone-9 3-methyltransferase
VQQYLQAEIDFVRARLTPGGRVLELGCGYGRVLAQLSPPAGLAVGVDTAPDSLRLARRQLDPGRVHLAQMDASRLGLANDQFDQLLCIQNGISAFQVDRRQLVAEAVRVTRPGGRVFFSSYAAAFWPERLAWFRLQAEAGLIGPIDEAATGEGVIVCRDGFRATTLGPADFRALADSLGLAGEIVEVDESSLFWVVAVGGGHRGSREIGRLRGRDGGE